MKRKKRGKGENEEKRLHVVRKVLEERWRKDEGK